MALEAWLIELFQMVDLSSSLCKRLPEGIEDGMMISY